MREKNCNATYPGKLRFRRFDSYNVSQKNIRLMIYTMKQKKVTKIYDYRTSPMTYQFYNFLSL